MPVAPVDQQGNVYFYEDSGVPKDSQEYLTIVAIHGLVYHGGIFRRLLPCLVEQNIRVICLNLRDYPGSSGYTSEELASFRSDNLADQSAAIRTQGLEIAGFLDHIITTHSIRPVSTEGGIKRGGIAVLGWSFGSIGCLSMLAHAGSPLVTTKNDLPRYLRTIVLFEAPLWAIGAKPPTGAYHPLRDRTIAPEEVGKRFEEWVSSYFPLVTDLGTLAEDTVAARRPLHIVPPGATADPSKIPTVLRMSADDRASCTDPGVVLRSFESMRRVKQSVHAQNVRKALMDTDGLWPNVEALVLWSDSGTPDGVWGSKLMFDMISAIEPGKVARQVRFAKLSGNHFAHWDNPEIFARCLLQQL